MTTTPDFTKLDYHPQASGAGYAEWKAALEQETGQRAEDHVWDTMEKIPVKPLYSREDLEGMEHLDYQAGIAPFLRGPYATMYVFRPWTVRQYAGFSTAEESNAFY
ncbi:MAG TPA: methylmalonyl-CoA mutase family protein, partial [Oceanipulchritudo sp.]|nr:methylmalonyl-CoA mutase family protein [Oceanipulchritudo sp.]